METKIVQSVRKITSIPSTVYNLEVEDNKNYFVEGILVHNSPNLIEDEAALISDESDAKAMRMVGGFTAFGTDFVTKLGNPFNRNHFLESFKDPSYHKIKVDYTRSLKEKNEYGEGRITEEFIEEMRKKPYFRVLYDCLFPESDDIDARGWTQLLSEDNIERAMAKDGEAISHIGEKE